MTDTATQLRHQRIHHEAAIKEIKGEYVRTRNTMLWCVENAQAALSKGKLHVVDYQLDVLAEMLGGE